MGSIRAANVILLGALSTGLDLPVDCWHDAVASCVPDGYRALDLEAFEDGRDMA